MRRLFVSIISIISCLALLVGCNDSKAIKRCDHSWTRIENLNEYTAVEKCSKCSTTRKYLDTENISYSSAESGFEIIRYSWDGRGFGRKKISDCDLGYAVIEVLSNLKETGEVIPKISDDVLDENLYYAPVERGTLWIDCGSIGLFRLSREMTEICKVETHFGEGKALQMTDVLEELLRQATVYYPYDYWSGTYKDGKITLEQVYKGDSAVEWVAIDGIRIKNEHHSQNNKISLRIKANESKTVKISLESQQSSDNLGSDETKEIELIKGKATTVDFTFSGFYNCSYLVIITVDNTYVNLLVNSYD